MSQTAFYTNHFHTHLVDEGHFWRNESCHNFYTTPNADQCRSKLQHWSQCRIKYLLTPWSGVDRQSSALRGISDQCQDFDPSSFLVAMVTCLLAKEVPWIELNLYLYSTVRKRNYLTKMLHTWRYFYDANFTNISIQNIAKIVLWPIHARWI